MPVIARQLTYIAAISASIAIFNLLPVIGLDGYYTLHVTLPLPRRRHSRTRAGVTRSMR